MEPQNEKNSLDLTMSQNPIGLAKQLIFDCAMELLYHTDKVSDDVVANKLLEIINAMDKIENIDGSTADKVYVCGYKDGLNIIGRDYVEKTDKCPICIDCPDNCPLDKN